MNRSSATPSGDRRATVSGGHAVRQRYLDALDKVLDWDPKAGVDIGEYISELRRECARWRIRVRELEGRR